MFGSCQTSTTLVAVTKATFKPTGCASTTENQKHYHQHKNENNTIKHCISRAVHTLSGTLQEVWFFWLRSLTNIIICSNVHLVGHYWDKLQDDVCGQNYLRLRQLHTRVVNWGTVCNIVGIDVSVVIFWLHPCQSYWLQGKKLSCHRSVVHFIRRGCMKEISGSYNKVASSYRPLWNLGVAKNYVAMVTDYNS